MRNTEIKVLPENIYIQDITQPWPRETVVPTPTTVDTTTPVPVASPPPPPINTNNQTPISTPTNDDSPPSGSNSPPLIENPTEPNVQDPLIQNNEEPEETEEEGSTASGEVVLDETAEYILKWELREDAIAITISVKGIFKV